MPRRLRQETVTATTEAAGRIQATMRIDAHMHLYASAAEGRAVVEAYPIVEYGNRHDVALSARDGSVQDGLAALATAGASAAWVLNSFELPELPHPPSGAGVWPSTPPHSRHADALHASNRWLCDVGAANPQLLPFVTIHPGVLGAHEAAAHVAELADHHGARGLKLHPIALRVHPDDPALQPTFAACAERALPVVAHCGPDRHGIGWSLPGAFAGVLERHPRLPLVLAHLGGGAWSQTAAFAAAYPRARFDLSEIVSWVGATRGPTPHQLVELIDAVGAERILLGSDFPWYEPADAIAQLLELPGLSAEQQAAILGANAAALVGLGA